MIPTAALGVLGVMLRDDLDRIGKMIHRNGYSRGTDAAAEVLKALVAAIDRESGQRDDERARELAQAARS